MTMFRKFFGLAFITSVLNIVLKFKTLQCFGVKKIHIIFIVPQTHKIIIIVIVIINALRIACIKIIKKKTINKS